MEEVAFRLSESGFEWRYCVLKQAIRLECEKGEEFPQPSLLSAWAELDGERS